jgi:hypothetical protein
LTVVLFLVLLTWTHSLGEFVAPYVTVVDAAFFVTFGEFDFLPGIFHLEKITYLGVRYSI